MYRITKRESFFNSLFSLVDIQSARTPRMRGNYKWQSLVDNAVFILPRIRRNHKRHSSVGIKRAEVVCFLVRTTHLSNCRMRALSTNENGSPHAGARHALQKSRLLALSTNENEPLPKLAQSSGSCSKVSVHTETEYAEFMYAEIINFGNVHEVLKF